MQSRKDCHMAKLSMIGGALKFWKRILIAGLLAGFGVGCLVLGIVVAIGLKNYESILSISVGGLWCWALIDLAVKVGRGE